MLIAGIATLHVLVAHYAVGGGLFLALETRHAYRQNDQEYLAYLHRHARFFILITLVLGAITGVGIWWTMGLASPLATETLLRIFVFAWAIEYVFFLVEIVAAFIFYYYWGRLAPGVHQAIAWIYAAAAWMSLLVITGITAFMLNPGRWPEEPNFWVAFFNPQFFPQLFARTGGAMLLASLFIYLHASLTVSEARLQRLIESRSAKPALVGSILVTIGGAWWYVALPESSQAALTAASALNLLMMLLFAVTVVVFVLLYLGPIRNPRWMSPGFAMALFVFGVIAFSTGEFLREAVRKPYVLYGVVLGNQILPEEIPKLRAEGYLQGGTWTRAWVAREYPAVLVDGQIDGERLLALSHDDQVRLGEVLFQYHCNDCHAAEHGLSAVRDLTQGWPDGLLRYVIEKPEQVHFFMPPWAGTQAEAELLLTYVKSIAVPRPSGMYYDIEAVPR